MCKSLFGARALNRGMVLAAAVAAGVFGGVSAEGAIVGIWDGDTDSNYHNAANWVGGNIPGNTVGSEDVVKFEQSFVNQPSIGTQSVPSSTSTSGVGIWLAEGLGNDVVMTVGSGLTMALTNIGGVAPVGNIGGYANTSILMEDGSDNNLTITGAGSLKLNNSAATNFRINNGGSLTLSTATLSMNGKAFIVSGFDPDSTFVLSSTTSGSGAITISFAGVATISGNLTSRSATTTLQTRTVLEYATNTSKLGSGGLALGGASVVLKGGSFAETAASATVNSGLTTLTRDGGTSSINMNAITRNNGGIINFGVAKIATTDTLNNSTTGIVGGWALVNGANWALNSSNAADGAIGALASYSAFASANANTENALLVGSASTAAKALFTLKIDTDGAGQSLTQTGTITLGQGAGSAATNQLGGLLFVGSHDYTITGSNITVSANNAELILNHFGTGVLRIESRLQDKGSLTGNASFNGTGTFVLTGSNTYDGTSYINGATVAISANVNLGSAAAGASVNINGGTLRATETFALDNAGANVRAISVGSRGATLDVANTKTLTVKGVLSGANSGAVTKAGLGTLELRDGVSTYTGRTYVNDGTLAVTGAGSINSTVGLFIDGGTVRYNSSVALTAPLTFVAGTLGGTGTINTAVVGGSGAFIAPGNSPGMQEYAGGIDFSAGMTYQWQLADYTDAWVDAGMGYDLLTISGGNLVLGGTSALEIIFDGIQSPDNDLAFWDSAHSWKIIDVTGGANLGSLDFAMIVPPIDYLYGSFATRVGTGADAGDIFLDYTLSTIPEPASLGILGLGGMVLLGRRRRSC